ncbi:archaemetzincin family Zn-dependent metalloprotease [Infirmifilum uzonense]|uniref:archaemetzincin family Zn-dependent metalloprotease n=1 Tax=Infirmifilum uzonense TaxID=1550241 RepID=UPI00069B70FB|nr:archaemetzincin family Zn-dependent metalloprotease [Infirmifilum uzonense]
MAEYAIKILSVGIPIEHIEWLENMLRLIFNASIVTDSKTITLGSLIGVYSEEREQLQADKLLDYLSEKIGVLPHQRVLVVIDGDGFVEGLNFVFGIAKPNWGGIVFTERLKPDLYGSTNSVQLFRARLLKESLHELGHSFGLPHCSRNCVMRFSNSVYDVDSKPATFCAQCQIRLNLEAPGLLRAR